MEKQNIINNLLTSLPSMVREVIDLLLKDDFTVAAVGGVVRSIALGEIPRDFDLSTDANEYQIINLLKDNFSVKRTEGHFPVVLVTDSDGYTIEVASFRSESGDGRFAKEWLYTTLRGDLDRRDFTINAMAVNLTTLELVDPFNGLDDIQNKIIRTPLATDITLKDDPMRITRAFMFKHRLGFDIHSDITDYLLTSNNLFIDAHGDEMTPERKKMEFEKGYKYAKSKIDYIKDLEKYNLLEDIFSGLYVSTEYLFETDNIMLCVGSLLMNNDFHVRKHQKYMIENLKWESETVNQIVFIWKLTHSSINDIIFGVSDLQKTYFNKLAKNLSPETVDTFLANVYPQNREIVSLLLTEKIEVSKDKDFPNEPEGQLLGKLINDKRIRIFQQKYYKMSKLYNSSEILELEDLYELQDSFGSSGTPFKYQLTQEEFEWANHIKGKYQIADWVLNNTDKNLVLTFNDPFELSNTINADGIPNKAVMLSDETALQKLFFWLSNDLDWTL